MSAVATLNGEKVPSVIGIVTVGSDILVPHGIVLEDELFQERQFTLSTDVPKFVERGNIVAFQR